MSTHNTGRGRGLQVTRAVALGAVMLALVGCEWGSFMDPSVVGRWEPTPVLLPILDRLDVIDEPSDIPVGISPVSEEDLVAEVREYVIGPNDLLTFSIYELITLGVESVQTRRVDELGRVRLPIIGAVECEGKTASQLEADVSQVLIEKGVLKDPIVSVIVQERRQNTFSVLGEPREGGTAIGTYAILENDFRLLDAMALARGADESVRTLYIIRQVPLSKPTTRVETEEEGPRQPTTPDGPTDAADLIRSIQEALEENGGGGDAMPDMEPETEGEPAPAPLQESLDSLEPRSPYVYVPGKGWVRVKSTTVVRDQRGGDGNGGGLSQVVTQRVIEIPYDRLVKGDMRYNIVIKPGDVIRVPALVAGNVYIGGEISRPGTYALPSEKLTLKQLVIAAGGLSPIAVPERVDLIRRIGQTHEATIRLDLKAIFKGTAPDVYLKPNDTVNVGTNFWATPLAVFRNGFRTSYGFGFVLDRNFGTDVFPP